MSTGPSKQITVIILTFNEEKHLARCIQSLLPLAPRICVVDSLSTDRTVEIARSLGAEVFSHPWKNYATQFQWGMEAGNIDSTWTMRIDADEYLTAPLQRAISQFMASPGSVNAVYLRRRIVFLGRAITYGFFYPALMLRLWHSGHGRIEQRWMDEHVVVENADPIELSGDLVDENLNDLSWWSTKHIGYATREVYDIVASRNRAQSDSAAVLTGQARRKRFIKEKIYAKLPSALRSSFYFFYRYIIGLGFLDGKAGFFFHFLQAYWYRTLVDARLYELDRQAASQNITTYELLRRQGVWEST